MRKAFSTCLDLHSFKLIIKIVNGWKVYFELINIFPHSKFSTKFFFRILEPMYSSWKLCSYSLSLFVAPTSNWRLLFKSCFIIVIPFNVVDLIVVTMKEKEIKWCQIQHTAFPHMSHSISDKLNLVSSELNRIKIQNNASIEFNASSVSRDWL